MKNTENIIVESFARRPTSLRVALVTETFLPEVNGVAMTLGRIVDGLLKRGHSVQLVRPRQTGSDTPRQDEGWDEVLARGVPIPRYGGLKFGLLSSRRLTQLWRLRRPDIVHVATEGPLGWSAIAAARKLNLPISSSFHTNFHNYSQHYGLGLLRTPIAAYLRFLHNRTHKTLVPTQAMAEELTRRGYLNVGLLSRGVMTTLFNPLRRSDTLRAKWGAKDDDLLVTYVGRLAKEKNVDLVIASFVAIQSRVPGAKLLFVGDGPMRCLLEERCPEAIFAGMRGGDDLAAHYASADLFLFPSLSETFGNVVPEALASGLAVVAYAQAAAAEVIRDGVNGRTVHPGDEAAFVEASVSVACNPAELTRLRNVASASVAHLDWDAVHEGFVQTLREVVAAREVALTRIPDVIVDPRHPYGEGKCING